jgi:hypothetical protein
LCAESKEIDDDRGSIAGEQNQGGQMGYGHRGALRFIVKISSKSFSKCKCLEIPDGYRFSHFFANQDFLAIGYSLLTLHYSPTISSTEVLAKAD